MRAYEVTRFGGPEVLRLGERPDPPAAAGDVTVDVRAVGLNPIDLLQRSGTLRFANPPRFPFVPGNEFSGVVTAVGSKVTSVAIGDAVIGRTDKARLGALAERVTIEATLVAPMPRSLDFASAAAVPLAGTTALQGIRDALSVRPDDRLLITGGSGVVGMFAIQLAARVGAHTVTTASAASEPLLRSLGADEVIDYRSRPVDESLGRFDKVFDLVGGAQTDTLLTLVSAGGRLVSVSSTPTPGSIRYDYAMSPLRAAALETVLWIATFGKRRRARKGKSTYRFLSMRPSSADLKELTALIDSGDLEIMLDSTYDFEHAADAFARVETRRAKGKVVVTVGDTA
ncbi:NADP-dependent oxidoreductase [Nonomuraea glycinis]|uniref:NADPH:quinone reductase n=1 Tax=Nonomuraea glycinis TaxID=2047744 RepID=A0A918E4B8_9ACTN|nr:NADP-dependent oxidoreductase [Nonomuraea glycinis]MCA2180330.1 NADP-dependent oxidoreductase [Nonomuraea glycinis]GGP04006.1 NADPH:quinone reductase [Nonomuraea glycinis]